MAMENFVGPKIKKAWRMKVKASAGNTNKKGTQGKTSEARAKVKQAKAPKDESKKK